MGEDCLVLNVWTPSLRPADKRPVMFWLHGGGFITGSDGRSWFDGSNLARKHDVVVVGINHRLNIFGYFYLAQLGGPKYADSGNVGMLDAVLALQWVRDNIANFGGDPGNVTIFGQSGGGYKVSTLLAMPMANGLFHKAIVESGSALRAIPAEAATASAQKFLDHLGLKPNQTDQLQQMPMEKLLTAMHEVTTNDGLPLGPVVDGRSLPRHPFDPTAPEISVSIPMLIGTAATENTLLIGGPDPATFSLDEMSLRTRLKALFKTGDGEVESLNCRISKGPARRFAQPCFLYCDLRPYFSYGRDRASGTQVGPACRTGIRLFIRMANAGSRRQTAYTPHHGDQFRLRQHRQGAHPAGNWCRFAAVGGQGKRGVDGVRPHRQSEPKDFKVAGLRHR